MKLDEWLDLVRVGKFLLTELLHFFLVLHAALFENGWLKFVPGKTSELISLLTEALVDSVDLTVDLVLAFHLNQFIKLRDLKVEKLLGKHMLILQDVLSLNVGN